MNEMTPRQRVLVIDDDPRIVRFTRLKLTASGYQVFTAACGEEALELVRVEQPDIIVLDIIMPGMDGFEVLQKLRALSDLPVIVFSARPENGPRALSLGASDFLVKPFDINDLAMRIQRTLGHR
jgi:two-component system KDP operon response regulator KdpE